MARVNISVPDSLYERLDRLRDRVNVSRVCAAALEKELDMIETRPRPSDPDVERLLQRLLSSQERWYQRGRDDGRRWAIESATRQELWMVGTQLMKVPVEQLAMVARLPKTGSPFPQSFSLDEGLRLWQEQDASGEVDEAAYVHGWRDAVKGIWDAVKPALNVGSGDAAATDAHAPNGDSM